MTDHWREQGLLDAFRNDYAKRRDTGPLAVWPSPLPEGEFAFNCHRFFMENPSLSGRGSAGASDVPKLTHTED